MWLPVLSPELLFARVIYLRCYLITLFQRMFPLALLVLFSTLPAQAADQQDSLDWLNKAIVKAKNLSYEGTFIYRRNDQLVAMSITHLSGPFGERERLLTLDGKPREIFRNSEGVTAIMPERKLVFGRHPAAEIFSPTKLLDVQRLSKYYKFDVTGSDRIADRKVRIITITPVDNFRYGYRMWIDEDKGLLLRSDVLDKSGEPLEQMMFTSMKIIKRVTPELLDSVTYRGIDIDRAKQEHDAMPMTKPSQWQVKRVPEGFDLVEHYQQMRNANQNLQEHMVYSDGMATVSVFVERLVDKEASFNGSSVMGAVNAFGATKHNYQLTVVGEVPAVTVNMIGQSIKFQE